MNPFKNFLTGLASLIFAGKSSRVGGNGGFTGSGVSPTVNASWDSFVNNGKFDIGSWLSKAWDSVGGSSALSNQGGLSGLIDALINRVSAQHMTGADREAAMVNYGMQSQFFQDYQSPQAQVQQYIDAGLNPALMFGRGASPASPISGSAQASAPSLDPGQLLSLMASLSFKFREVSADTALKGAQANLLNAQALYQRNENLVWAEKFGFWKQLQYKTFDNIDADTFMKNAAGRLSEQHISESEAKSTLLHYQGLVEKQNALDIKRMNQSLLDLRESAKNLNEAQAAFDRSSSELNEQKLKEAKDSWAYRKQTLENEMRKSAAEAGISEREFNAFWSDKRLNELLVLSEIFQNYKMDFKAFGIGGSYQGFDKLFDSRTPSLYPSWASPVLSH